MNFKKRTNFLFGVLLLTGSLLAQNVCVSTPKTSLVLSAPEGGTLRHLYYGNRLSEADLQNISAAEANHAAYPEYGLNAPVETALAVKHADGNMTLQLEVLNVTTEKGGDAVTTVVALKDKVYPFFVNVCYRAWQDADVIESWTEISHQEKKPVVLNQFASGYLPIRRGDVWLSHLSGSWANEGVLTQEPLTPGMKVIKNKDGVRNSHTDHAEVMFSLDGRPQENTGNVIGAALCYSGNYKLRIETHDDEYHHFFAGINEENSTYSLKKDELFRTPELALTYSGEGLSGASRNFHRWARLHKLAHGTTPRKILLNSWEGVYFDINQQGMDQMMADIASMGGELFVMDDGWFAERDNDICSLGDWRVNEKKLGRSLAELADQINDLGLKFGIWVEPEMISEDSDLYRAHPDWVLALPGKAPTLGRDQLVLDLSRADVRDNLFEQLCGILDQAHIEYVKWDYNRCITDAYSRTTTDQGKVLYDYMIGVYDLLERLIKRYPKVLFEGCSAGGGRYDAGMMYYTPQIWTSDNTDADNRLTIQYGSSFGFPLSVMGAHVSACPNEINNRTVPLTTRGHVAMAGGSFGYELDLNELPGRAFDHIRRQISLYHEIENIVCEGELYRLSSPMDDDVCAWENVLEDGSEAIMTAVVLKVEGYAQANYVTLRGLTPGANYRELTTGVVYPANALMDMGMPLPVNTEMYASYLYRFERVEG